MEILMSRSETPVLPDEQQPCMRTAECNVIASLERLLKQAVARGQLPKDTDARLGAMAINAFISGLVRQWVVDESSYDLAEAGPRLVRVMLEGLRAAPPRRVAQRRRAVATAA